MTDFKCQCCGQSVDRDDPAMVLKTTDAPALVGRMLDCLLARFGQWVPRTRVVDYVYAERIDGGPDNAYNVVSVMKHKAGELLKDTPLIMEGRPWRGDRLRWRDERRPA